MTTMYKAKKTERIYIRITSEQKEKIEKTASEQGLSMSALLVRLVTKYGKK